MKALRQTLLAAFLAVGALPGWAAGATAPPPASPPPPDPGRQQDLQQRLDAAQRRLKEATNEVAQLSAQLGRRFAFQLRTPYGGPPPRALLGVSIDNDKGDAKGARVRDVSPGSAAADAGIKVGDIITNVGGKDLTKEADPGRALVDQMSQVEPNLKLKVDVLRDGKKMSFDVTPRPAPVQIIANRMAQMPDMPGVHTFQLQRGAVGPGQPRIEIREFRTDDGRRFRGLEFATLSPKLGTYFGVKSGVLVVRAGENSPFKLQDGDVILSIDGREPTTAQHAGRILHSYGDGEKLKLHIMRNRKTLDLNVTMPGDGPGEDHDG